MSRFNEDKKRKIDGQDVHLGEVTLGMSSTK